MASNMDLAVLGIEIRSDGVTTASNRLKQFTSSAAAAETATSRLAGRQREAANAAGSLGASFSKIRNQVLALVAAYKSLNVVTSFVGRGMDYSSTLEQAQIGISSLITSMAKLSDEQGNVLQGMDKYIAAQGVAADMMKEIQVYALNTTATTQELVRGVQTVMAPAIQAGMALKDIPKFAVAGAQAMQAMGIPLEQMRTELEALLTGRISSVQDLLAPRLFPEIPISQVGEYIRGLKESGQLIDELFKRLRPFEQAGQDIGRTWLGLKQRFSDALDIFSGQTTTKFVDSMKEAISGLVDLMVEADGRTLSVSKDIDGVAVVLTEIEGIIGRGILSAANKLADSVRSLNKYINEIGTNQFLEDLARGAKVATAAFLALATARRAASATFTVFTGTGETQQVTGLRQYISTQYEAIKAIKLRAAQELAAAQMEKQAAIATLQKFQAEKQATVSVREATQAGSVKAAAQKRLNELTIAATAAEIKYAQALRASSAASVAAMIGKGAINKLMAFFGGPFGFALTAATVGFTLLQTRTDAVTEATESLTKAEKSYTDAITAATDETGKLNQRLSAAQKLKVELAQIDIENAFDKQIQAVQESINKITPEAWLDDWRNVLGLGEFGSSAMVIPQEFRDAFNSLGEQLRSRAIDAKTYADRLAELRQKAIDAGYGGSALVSVIEDLSRDEGAISKLISLQEKMDKIDEAARRAASGVQELNSASNGLAVALDKALTGASLEAYISGLGKEQQAIAKGLTKDLKLTEDELRTVLSGQDLQGYDPGKLKQYISLQRQIWLNNQGPKQTTKDDTTRENLRRLREEIDQLSGSSQQASAAMNKKLFEISKLGKEAKLSSDEIQKLKEEYAQAFQVKTLRAFDEEMAKLTDDATKLRQLEIEKTMAEWGDRFRAAGLSAEEAAPKLEKMKQALERKNNYEDLQVVADFYKELGEKAGQYGLGLEYTNKMIDEQAAAWKRVGIPPEYIEQLVYIRKLEASTDGWDGVKRAMKSYYSDAMNLGRQFEDLTTSILTGLEDALVEFTTTGKMSFSDLANSIVSDLVRIAYQAMVVAPLVEAITGGKSSGGLFGGLFGSVAGLVSGGKSSSMSVSGGLVSGSWSPTSIFGWARGGVFSGGNISDYSGKVVSQPTAFSFGQHLSAFASGGGVMGEAGPEAILPLDRINGKLGVRGYLPDYAMAAPEIVIQINNNTSQPMQAKTTSTPNGQGGFNIEIVLDQLEMSMVQRDSSGRSRFANHYDRTRGLSRAGSLYR